MASLNTVLGTLLVPQLPTTCRKKASTFTPGGIKITQGQVVLELVPGEDMEDKVRVYTYVVRLYQSSRYRLPQPLVREGGAEPGADCEFLARCLQLFEGRSIGGHSPTALLACWLRKRERKSKPVSDWPTDVDIARFIARNSIDLGAKPFQDSLERDGIVKH